MSPDRKLAELLDAATNDVPSAYLAPPLAAIHGRVRRRRRMFGAVTAAAVVVVLAGGYSAGQRLLAEPAPQVPVGPAVSPTGSPTAAASTGSSGPALSWVSAMVARDDTTITVYTGVKRCKELDRPQARITAQDAAQVTIEVTGRVVPAGDCSTSGVDVPLVVKLAEPLGERKLIEAVSLRSHPTYFERYLPDLESTGRWSPFSVSWEYDETSWHGGFNGPAGSELDVRAQTPESVRRGAPVGTVKVGPYEGVITGSERTMWTVSWQAGGATYSLQLVPGEGKSFTLTEFKQELAGLWS